MSELEDVFKTKRLLEEMAGSIQKILFARFSGLTPAEREDVEQEVKLKLWRAVASGKKIDNLRSYLWKAVVTTALDILEAKKGLCSFEAQAELPGGFEVDGGKSREGRLVLERAAESLSPKRRTVVKMYMQGADLARIAATLSWSEPKTRHLLYRGLKDIKNILRSQGQAGPENKKRTGGVDEE